jgi:hypothetical protein
MFSTVLHLLQWLWTAPGARHTPRGAATWSSRRHHGRAVASPSACAARPAVCRNSGGQNAPSAVLTSRGHAAARRPADPSQARVAHRHHSPYAAAGSRRDMNERRAADLAPVVAVPGQISLPVEAGVPTPRSSSQSESSKRSSDTPRLAVTRAEAARALGMSVNSFERHVQPELRIVRRGKLRLIPVREIERWLEINAESTVERL